MLRAAASFDAQATLGFLVSQTSAIEQEVYAIRYADIQYPNLVPVETSAYPWARTVTYFTVDHVGQADRAPDDRAEPVLPTSDLEHLLGVEDERLPLEAGPPTELEWGAETFVMRQCVAEMLLGLACRRRHEPPAASGGRRRPGPLRRLGGHLEAGECPSGVALST